MLVSVGAAVVLFALVIVASIVLDLFFTPRRAVALAPLTSADLVACNRSVRGLIEGLVRETAALESATLEGELVDLGARWDTFDGDWQQQWDETGARCRFGELEGTGKGTAYDRMAWVYRSLPTTKLKFRELMARFSRDLGVEVAEMRGALDKSLSDLSKPGTGQGN